jgi:hypothetical protein
MSCARLAVALDERQPIVLDEDALHTESTARFVGHPTVANGVEQQMARRR